jgi:tetratricopeptide (TPR) repeat protein
VVNLNKFWNLCPGSWIVIWLGIILFSQQATFAQLKTINVEGARSSKLFVYEGVEEATEGYWETAAIKFEKALEHDSQNYVAYYCHLLILDILDGRTSKGIGKEIFIGIDAWIFSNYVKARNIFEAVEKDQPGYGIIYLFKGLNEESLELFDEAYQDYDNVINLEPEFIYAYVKRGRLLARQKKYEDAMKDFNRAIKIDSTYYAAYYERGTVYQDLDQYQNSIKDYERAYYLYPAIRQTLHESLKICEGYNNLGMTNLQSGKYKAALKNFNDAINWNPNFYEPFYNRGITFRHLQLYDAAISDFNKVLDFDTAFVDVYYNIALVYQQLEDIDKALHYLKLAQIGEPTHIQTLQTMGEIYYEQRKFDLAIKMFKRILSIDDANFWGYYWVAMSYDARRKYPQAIEAYENFIKIAPDIYYDQKIKMYERAERLRKWLEKKKK